MEVYYKERQKQLNRYTKNIKKLAKTGPSDELTQMKKEYIQLLVKPPPFKKEVYKTEYAYSDEINRRIREEDSKFLTLKMDICYDLRDDMIDTKELDEYEKSTTLLKKTREAFLSKRRDREILEEETKKKKQEQLRNIMETYPYLEKEDKKKTYQEIQELSEKMANQKRKVIAYEIENRELEYRLTQLYDPPLYHVKISL